MIIQNGAGSGIGSLINPSLVRNVRKIEIVDVSGALDIDLTRSQSESAFVLLSSSADDATVVRWNSVNTPACVIVTNYSSNDVVISATPLNDDAVVIPAGATRFLCISVSDGSVNDLLAGYVHTP